MLTEDPQDRSVELLTQISLQLSSFSINSQFLNSTVPAVATPRPFKPSNTVISINMLSFFSLALSLMVAVFAILVQQWLRQYLKVSVTTTKEQVCIRQRRYNALQAWGVHRIISSLSVVLQTALMVFLVALTSLLWSLHHPTAIFVASAVSPLVAGLIMTIIMPTVTVDCPYRSPLSWGMRTTAHTIGHGTQYLAISTAYTLLKLMTWCLRRSTCTRHRTTMLRVRNQRKIGHLDKSMKTARDNLVNISHNWSGYEESHKRDSDTTNMNVIFWTLQNNLARDPESPVQLAACLLGPTQTPLDTAVTWLAFGSEQPRNIVSAVVNDVSQFGAVGDLFSHLPYDVVSVCARICSGLLRWHVCLYPALAPAQDGEPGVSVLKVFSVMDGVGLQILSTDTSARMANYIRQGLEDCIAKPNLSESQLVGLSAAMYHFYSSPGDNEVHIACEHHIPLHALFDLTD